MPDQPRPRPAAPARNDAAWPAFAHLLASAAGCDCQMLALSLAERGAAVPPERPAAKG